MTGSTDRPKRRMAAWLAALAGAALVAACGGGGGGGGDAASGAASDAASGSPRAALYNQWGLRTIKADRAYRRLEARDGPGAAPGSGQTLGAVDSGIDEDHPVFAGKSVSETLLGVTDETGDVLSHGTAVASVMVGRPNDAYAAAVEAPRGVAWGADIAMFAVRLGRASDDNYVPISLAGLNRRDGSRAAYANAVTRWTDGNRSIDFSNMSFGFLGIIDQYSKEDLEAHFSAAIEALVQERRANKTVFVWSAGNANGRDCRPEDFPGHTDLCVGGKVVARSVEIDAGLPARIPELLGHTIAVVAVGQDGRIARFSNRCGIAADWCIAAPGVEVRVALFGPDPGDGTPGVRGAADADGTSFAAPMVTGGLAVMKHVFRDQLSNTALVSRLLATANRSGIYANPGIYGQGLMDLEAATAPVGTIMVALGDRVGGPGSSLAGTRFTAGGALGDGLAHAFAGREIAAFDSLGAPFWFALGDLAGPAPARPILARLRAFAAPRKDDPGPATLWPRFAALAAGDRLSLGVLQAPPSGAGHLSLAGRALALDTGERHGLRVAAFSTEGLRGQSPASGAALSWRPGDSPLGLTGGVVGERRTMLGSTAGGAFGRLSGNAAFAGIEGGATVGAWRLGAGAELGTVRAAARGGMIAAVSPLTTSAFALSAGRILANGDGIRFSAAQPLRVEAGRARLSVPVGRSQDGLVRRRSLLAGLEPGGRQIDIAARWHRTLAGGGTASIGAGWTRQPGHDAASDPELSLLANWRYAF